MAKVCIVGPGAVGSTLACSLRKVPTVVVGKRPETVEVHGYCPGYTFKSLPWELVSDSCTATLIAVKAHQTASLLEWLDRVRSPILVVVQNGFYGLEMIEARLGSNAVVAGGVAEFGAVRKGSRVEVRGPGRLLIGCKGRDCTDYLQLLAALYDAPISVELVSDITPWRWLKLIINSIINTITAIYMKPNGVLLENPKLRQLAEDLAIELSEIVENFGVALPLNPRDYLERIVEATSENLSSTLQDLINCRVPEIGWIVAPFLEFSESLRDLFNSLSRIFMENCGIKIPMPGQPLSRKH